MEHKLKPPQGLIARACDLGRSLRKSGWLSRTSKSICCRLAIEPDGEKERLDLLMAQLLRDTTFRSRYQ